MYTLCFNSLYSRVPWLAGNCWPLGVAAAQVQSSAVEARLWRLAGQTALRRCGVCCTTFFFFSVCARAMSKFDVRMHDTMK